MRHCLIATMLAVGLLIGGCSASQPHGQVLIGSPGCVASQLDMQLIFVGYATGNAEGIVDIRNRSTRDCQLHGYPTVQLVDARGDPLPTHAIQTTTSFFRPHAASTVVVTLSTGSQPLSIDRPIAGHAYIDMSWGDSQPPCEQPSSFVITPPGGNGAIVVSATPPTGGAPGLYMCGAGAIGILPIQSAA